MIIIRFIISIFFSGMRLCVCVRVRVCCKATTQSHFNVGYRDCIQTTNCCSSMGLLRGIFKIEFITEKWHSLLYTGLRHYQFGKKRTTENCSMLLWCLVCWVLRPLEQGERYNIDRKSPTSTHITRICMCRPKHGRFVPGKWYHLHAGHCSFPLDYVLSLVLMTVSIIFVNVPKNREKKRNTAEKKGAI